MYLKMYLLIFPFVFRSAESLAGSGVRRAEDNEFPFVVSIGYSLYARDETNPDRIMQKLHFCSGSLITSRQVLTAAHCIQGKAMSDLRVLVGSVDLRQTHPYFVRSWKSYDMWADENNVPDDNVADNDIAIVELTRVVNEANVVPGRLTTNNMYELIGADSIVVGWGLNTDNIANVARYQSKVEVKVLSPMECEENIIRAHGQYFLLPSEFCTKADPSAHLECGDSGGPLISNGVIIGVSQATCPDDPLSRYHVNLHMDITYYRRFIDDVIQH